ncbi:MAG: hypothetical protein KatS3mg007_1833 [Thermoanaerobaculum sp.]|nr:MAG: hypothetical protein KatS3mg007_1833 [Thermoanaerobaculum sp.]
MVLPTLGTITYQYGEWANPSGSVGCYDKSEELALVQTFLGVTRRTLTNPLSSMGGTTNTSVWTYSHDAPRLANGQIDDNAQVSWTWVTDPNGNKTKHYFRTKWCLGNDGSGWDYGLPYSRGANGELSTPPYPSVEYYQGGTTLLRSVAVDYEHDPLTLINNAPPGEESLWHDSNRRLKTQRVTYHDDANRFVLTTYGDYDGLGHYRQATTTTNIPSAGLSRTSVTNFNPGGRPAETSRWVLTTFSEQWTQETVSGSLQQAKQEYCFEAGTGFLQRVRVLSSNSGVRSPNDILRVFTRDAYGNLVTEELYGGDTQLLPTSSSVCALSVSGLVPVSRTRHTYQYGARASSVVENPQNTAQRLTLFSRTIDPATGLVASETRTDGLTTFFAYDSMGRLTWVKPQSGSDAWVGLQYTRATSSTLPAKVDVFVMPNGVGTFDTNQALARMAYEFDGFGRVFRESRRMPANIWVKRVTEYNSLGQVSRVSEWVPFGDAATKWTTTTYDRFGRPLTVTTPDGKQTSLSYMGARQLTRLVSVATGVGVESSSTVTEIYDGFGRLVSVSEPSGSGGSLVTTSYTYDVGARLIRAVTPVGATTQTRAWTYDQRGFLLGEQLPEVGTVSYTNYDARGLAGRRTDGASDLVTCYDFAGRVTTVGLAPFSCSAPDANRVVKELSYGTSGVEAGKLKTAVRHNRTEFGDEVVQETFWYNGRGGRVSQKQTQVSLRYPGVETRTYTQTFSWDQLGNVEGVGYPDDASLGDPSRSVSYSFNQGYLTAVPGYITSQSYHPNGMVAQRVFANNVREVYTLNPDGMARWGRMQVVSPGNQVLWDSGSYQYDGAGNIKAMVRGVGDQDSFSYDKVSRLVQASFKVTGGGIKTGTYSFDAAGNLTSEQTTDYGTRGFSVDAGTNRLASCSYDGAGRMVSCGGLSFSWTVLGELYRITGTGINRSFLYTADGEKLVLRNHIAGTAALTLRDLGGNPLRTYIRYASGSWAWSSDDVNVGRLRVASVYPSGVQYVHSDHLGSPRKITDGAGNVKAYSDFYPFGLPAATNGIQPRWFSGYELEHQNTASAYTDDLYFLHARWYFPQLARFLSPDPVRGFVGLGQSFNLYAYVRNNAPNLIDPFGLAASGGSGGGTGQVTLPDGRTCVFGDDGEWHCSQFHEEVTVTGAKPDGGVPADYFDRQAMAELAAWLAMQERAAFFGQRLSSHGFVLMGRKTWTGNSSDWTLTILREVGKLEPVTSGMTMLVSEASVVAVGGMAIEVVPPVGLKLGAGGHLQFYDAAKGTYVGPTIRGLVARASASPAGLFATGFAAGFDNGPIPFVPVAGPAAYVWGYRAGQLMRQIVGW